MTAVAGESPRRLRPLLLALGVAGVAWAYWGLDLLRHASVDGMRALVESHAPYGPLVFMGMVVAGVCTQVPFMGTLMVAVGGVLFGGVLAFVYGWVGSLVGTTVTFLLARYVARERVERLLNERYTRLRALDDRLARHGFWTVLGLRVVGFLAPPLNWGLGLTGVHVQHYVAGTALGLLPGLAAVVFFADSIVSRSPGSGGLSVVAILRGVSLLAFGGPLLMGRRGRGQEAADGSRDDRGSRIPLVANIVGFGVFFPLLFASAGSVDGPTPLLLAIAGSMLAVGGAVVVRRSREALGAAWSFVPRAGAGSAVVTTGPYRLVRHPIYLGLSMLAAGEAVAFGSGPALLVVGAALVPSFLWRAKVEEQLLVDVFGERYLAYRTHTKMVVPYIL